MKIKDKDLRDAIAACSVISSRKCAIPVLSEIYAKADGDGTCLFAASDLETEVVFYAKAAGVFEGMMPTKEIVGIAKQNTRSGFFDISGNGTAHTIEGLGRHTVTGCAADDYPMKHAPAPAIYGSLNKKRFLEAVNAAAPHCYTDQLRPIMTGLSVEASGGQCLFTATDCVTMYQADLKYSGPDMAFVIPPGALPAIKTMCGLSGAENIRISHNGGMVYIGFGRSYIHTRAIEGEIPPFKSVVPLVFHDAVGVSPQRLIKALEAVLPTCSQATHACGLYMQNGSLELSVSDEDFGRDGNITIPCRYSGEPLKKRINALFLLRILKSVGGEAATLQFARETVVVKDAMRSFNGNGTFGLCMLVNL